MDENVTGVQVTAEQVRESSEIWQDPQVIMRLIDLMFIDRDEEDIIPS